MRDVSLLPVGEERADIVLFIIRARNVALNRFKYFSLLIEIKCEPKSSQLKEPKT